MYILSGESDEFGLRYVKTAGGEDGDGSLSKPQLHGVRVTLSHFRTLVDRIRPSPHSVVTINSFHSVHHQFISTQVFM